MAKSKVQGKTDFVEEVLRANPRANAKAVKAAWSEAGRDGTISPTLIQKVRKRLGLTRPGRGRVQEVASNGTARGRSGLNASRIAFEAAAPATIRNGSHGPNGAAEPAPRPAPARPAPAHRLEELEADLDGLIYKLMGMGDVPEVLEVLRRARRLLIRSLPA